MVQRDGGGGSLWFILGTGVQSSQGESAHVGIDWDVRGLGMGFVGVSGFVWVCD